MISYSPKAARALARLKRAYNDVDIYVEDTRSQNLWVALLRKCLPKRRRLTSVIMLGGREAVLAACRLDQAKRGRKRLYVIDGDFDFLLGRRKPRLRHLYRLRAYCVENILLGQGSMLNAGCVCQPNKTEADIESTFQFLSWRDDLVTILRPLFAVFAVARKLAPSIQTVAFPINRLYENTPDGPRVSSIKVMRKARGISREICGRVGRQAFRTALDEVRSRLAKLIAYDQVVSGKDYIFPCFYLRMRRLLGFKGAGEQLKVLLANGWSPLREPWFARRLKAL